jgi:hypothetical protein
MVDVASCFSLVGKPCSFPLENKAIWRPNSFVKHAEKRAGPSSFPKNDLRTCYQEGKYYLDFPRLMSQ